MEKVKRLCFTADDGNGTYEHVRLGARAILIRDGRLLLGHELATGYYTFPGGGHEDGESIEETCVREIAEEMGMIVEVIEEIAVVESRWQEHIYENHFFRCEYKGLTDKHQTLQEEAADLQPEWVTLTQAKAIFSDPEVRTRSLTWQGCYKRDLFVMDVVSSDSLCHHFL